MTGYWFRHRFLFSLILCTAVAVITGSLFAYPCIVKQADTYNSQSIYKNTRIDFIAPEPSFEQVKELPGTHGIDKVFPFFMTKTSVYVNGTTRTTTVLLSSQEQDLDATMYTEERLIEKTASEQENPILVDWQFCRDTSSRLGDTVAITINGNSTEFKIYAIYETNALYDGGAILALVSDEQIAAIQSQSSNNGYSGMYVSASDYNTCRTYLTQEYRPLGRLKDRELFDDDSQYQVHYDAIMASGYENEITDFRIRESDLDRASSSFMVWLGAVLTIAIIIGFNFLMAKRGCERGYFSKHCIPQGTDIRPYYTTSFCFELLVCIAIYAVVLLLCIRTSNEYIPRSALGARVAVIPIALVVSEVIALFMNRALVAAIGSRTEEKPYQKTIFQSVPNTNASIISEVSEATVISENEESGNDTSILRSSDKPE